MSCIWETRLSALLDGLGLLGLLGGDVALPLVDGLLRFHLRAQGSWFSTMSASFCLHIVQEVPVRGEGLERGGPRRRSRNVDEPERYMERARLPSLSCSSLMREESGTMRP